MDFSDLGELGKNLALLIPLILLILANFFLKKRKAGGTPLEVVISLLAEIDYNQKLTEAFLLQWQAKNFKTASWKRNSNKLDFLDQPLQIALSDAFNLANDFNRQIDAAKRYKSTSYLSTINMERLRKPLAQSRQGLEEWLQLNKGKLFKKRLI